MIKINSWDETLADAQKMCTIEGLIAHDYIPDPQEIMKNWAVRDTNYYRDKLIAYKEKEPIGCIHIIQGRKENNHIAYFELYVHPNHQHQGMGTLIFNEFVNRVKKVGCTHIHSFVYDHPNWEWGKAFLAKYGFNHISTNREYKLTLQQADLSQYQSTVNEVKAQGFTFLEPKLESINSNEHYEKLEELRWAYFKDMPYPEGIIPTRPNYDLWRKEHKIFETDNYGIELIIVSPNGEYVGCTKLSTYKTEPKKCWTDNLGVRRDFRRKRLATALKIEALSRLKERGFHEIRTDNEENNPMYKINVNLGFDPVPFSLEYMKAL
jgi:GNAT superfamily N-acetyltransferase